MSEVLGDKLNIVYEDTLLEITPELMKKTIVKQNQEIERLNNIINGLDNTIENLEEVVEHKDNIIKEVREYIENNWISQKDADNYRFDAEELDIEISDIAVLFDILDKENK